MRKTADEHELCFSAAGGSNRRPWVFSSEDIFLAVLSPAEAVVHRPFDASGGAGGELHLSRPLVKRLPAKINAKGVIFN